MTPEKVWWHGKCGFEAVADERPVDCPRCGEERVPFSDLGYRVGYNPQTYVYYSTLETALTDRRLK